MSSVPTNKQKASLEHAVDKAKKRKDKSDFIFENSIEIIKGMTL